MGSYARYRQQLIDTGVLTPQEAKDFFVDLFAISNSRIGAEVGVDYATNFPTKQYSGPGGFQDTANGWRFGQPLGICDHSTATDSHRSILKWFSSYSKWKHGTGTYKKSEASACFVIALSGEPFLLIDFWNGKSDWHEPVLNGITLAIEHVNCGELRTPDDTNFVWWPHNWSCGYPHTGSLAPQLIASGTLRWRQPFTKNQIFTNLVIKRAFVCLYANSSAERVPRSELFVDHATYRDDKSDQGPLWPLAELRDWAFRQQPLSESRFYAESLEEDPTAFPSVTALDPQFLHFSGFGGFLPVNHNKVQPVNTLVHTAQTYLQSLGYAVAVNGDVTDTLYTAELRRFQADNSLPVTGIADPLTRSIILNKMVAKHKSLS